MKQDCKHSELVSQTTVYYVRMKFGHHLSRSLYPDWARYAFQANEEILFELQISQAIDQIGVLWNFRCRV